MINPFPSQVQKRLQLIQEKFLSHKTLDELNAMYVSVAFVLTVQTLIIPNRNEAIEQQATATRRKRLKMSEASSSEDIFSSDITGFSPDNLNTFSSGNARRYKAGLFLSH